MKIVIALALLGLASAKSDPERLPSFKVFQDKSLGGIPDIEITFANGHVDRMVLERFYSNEVERQARKLTCNFFGHLQNERTACVAVTGCPGQDDLEMTILSEHSGSQSMIVLHKDNSVEVIEKDDQITGEGIEVPESRRREANDDEIVIEEDLAEEMFFEELCTSGSGGCLSVPETNLMEIKVWGFRLFKQRNCRYCYFLFLVRL